MKEFFVLGLWALCRWKKPCLCGKFGTWSQGTCLICLALWIDGRFGLILSVKTLCWGFRGSIPILRYSHYGQRLQKGTSMQQRQFHYSHRKDLSDWFLEKLVYYKDELVWTTSQEELCFSNMVQYTSHIEYPMPEQQFHLLF